MLSILYFFMTGFWLWMLYDCVQNESDKQLWIWILIFTNFAGACIYFLTRLLSQSSIPIPNYFARWTRQLHYKRNRRFIGKAEKLLREVGNRQLVIGNW